MFSHVMVGSDDIERSKNFYNSVLGVLGVKDPVVNVNDTGQTRLFYIHNDSIFCVTEPINGKPMSAANGSTIGFTCDSSEQVKELHDVAVANGANKQGHAP
ncbi:VOC family protein [Neptuniibacter pectenicola]|uniref:VOC family protein n=1 Tax=Neptuniibacter pectenicola TaxID=1806669 RepID=UPI0009ED18FE|nr:VOC family protein [Neptuniibacter pectenicola]